MQKTNKYKSIDKHLRSRLIRRLIIIVFTAIVFVGFMSFALYKAYGPNSKTVNIFSDIMPESNDATISNNE